MKHPIEVPPLLFAQWWTEGLALNPGQPSIASAYVARKAAEWAADLELEECCKEFSTRHNAGIAERLRAARRPKPPSLKDQALEALKLGSGSQAICFNFDSPELATIRRAIESIPDADES